MTALPRRRSYFTTSVAVSLAIVASPFACLSEAKEFALVQLPIPRDDHDPLYIRQQTIKWAGSVVRFKYVLDVPILGDAGGVRRFKSNEVEGTMDCARRTFAIGTVTTYSGTAATGEAIYGYTPKPGEQPPKRIDERKGSTFGYLFRYLCTPN
jgi:hypothetical protein